MKKTVTPGFKSFEMAKKGQKRNKIMYIPVLCQHPFVDKKTVFKFLTQREIVEKDEERKIDKQFLPEMDEPIMVIQVENKELNELNRNNRFFDLLDEMLLRTYAEWVSNVVEKVVNRRLLKEEISQE